MVIRDPAELVVLTAGYLELVICPGVGGSIARFDLVDADGRTPILRGCDGVPASVLDAASFPLVPFVNRIAGGRFTFRGREVRLAPNMEGDRSPLHGQGWLANWDALSVTPRDAELRFEHPSGEWPWSYVARQRFRMDEEGVEIALSCTNRSREPMPCGLGQHPYFNCTRTTRLRTKVANVWTIDENILPVERIPARGRFDINDGAVCGLGLDHGFDGWGGDAVISDRALPFDVNMASDGAKFFQLYSPQRGGIFVIEPVSHANAALNADEGQWSALGIRVVAPGEEMSLTMRLSIIRR
ncbi:MAG TPA: aldose 1-epimerase [Sphingomicrobium sp.]|nr:aldose 1-epimerase [Sphingomicrobium sp.]